jgi:transcriptional regulator with XRE-family HTH domain
MSKPLAILGEKFAALRRSRYLTQQEFAVRLGMSVANVRRLEQSEVGGMQVKNFRRLAELLHVSPDELRRRIGTPSEQDWDESARREPALPPSLVSGSVRPVVEIDRFRGVSATRPDDRDAAAEDRTPAPPGAARRFSAIVDGDCMEPKYRHGEVVIFSVDAAELEGIVEGRNYFVQFHDGQNTFKRLFVHPQDADVLVLRCWNPRYPDRAVHRDAVKLVSRATHKLVADEWEP